MKNRSIRLAITAAAALFAGLLSQAVSAMDINGGLQGNSDFSTSLMWKDLIKTSREWKPCSSHTLAWSGGNETVRLELDENGYPTSLPTQPGVAGSWRWRSIVLCDIWEPAVPLGTYTLLFDGTGEVRLEWQYEDTFVGNGGTNRFEFELPSVDPFNTDTYNWLRSPRSKGFIISIMRSDATDPVRNLKLIIPDENGGTSYVGTEDAQPFNPVFLRDLIPFKALRAMDLCHANSNMDSLWSERPGKKNLFMGQAIPYYYPEVNNEAKHNRRREIAWEYMIELANIMRKDIWICLPTLSNEDYWRNLARMFEDCLRPELNVYLEFGNETWNGIFVGYQNSITLNHGIGLDKSIKISAYQTRRIAKVWEEVFTDDSRIRPVVSGQKNNTWVLQMRTDALLDPSINPDGWRPYALSVTGYFGQHFMAEDHAEYGDAKAQADKLGVKLIAYEGGMGSGISPALYDIYMEQLPRLSEYFSEFFQFTIHGGWSASGNWGSKEYAGQPLEDAYKYRALYNVALQQGQFDPNELISFNPMTYATPIVDGQVVPVNVVTDQQRQALRGAQTVRVPRVTLADGILRVGGSDAVSTVSILTADGRTVMTRRLGSGADSHTVDLSHLAAGTYLVSMKGDRLSHTLSATLRN